MTDSSTHYTHCPERCLAFPASLRYVFRDVDLILHAGDVGKLWVLQALSEIAPVIAVHGNDNTEEAQRELPYKQVVNVGGRTILLCHGHEPDREKELLSRQGDAWEPKLSKRVRTAQESGAQVFILGHMHIPMVWNEDGIILVNPGAIASGNAYCRQTVQTVAKLTLDSHRQAEVLHIDLAHPEVPYDPAFDVSEGFSATLQRYSALIIQPELRSLIGRVHELELDNFTAVKESFLRLSHECWSGRKETISVVEVRAAFQGDPDIPLNDKKRLSSFLSA